MIILHNYMYLTRVASVIFLLAMTIAVCCLEVTVSGQHVAGYWNLYSELFFVQKILCRIWWCNLSQIFCCLWSSSWSWWILRVEFSNICCVLCTFTWHMSNGHSLLFWVSMWRSTRMFVMYQYTAIVIIIIRRRTRIGNCLQKAQSILQWTVYCNRKKHTGQTI